MLFLRIPRSSLLAAGAAGCSAAATALCAGSPDADAGVDARALVDAPLNVRPALDDVAVAYVVARDARFGPRVDGGAGGGLRTALRCAGDTDDLRRAFELGPRVDGGAGGGLGTALRCAGDADDLRRAFELGAPLGHGRFGAVRRAVHRASGRTCAIKAVGAEAAEESSYLTSRRVEIEALVALDGHPNVVQLLGVYGDARDGGDETLYLVEELCDGGTLLDRPPRAADDAARAARAMLRAVAAVHARGLAHRDLKEDNFVFAGAGRDATLKLIDFGLALPLARRDERGGGGGGAAMEAAGTLERSAPETLPVRDAATGAMLDGVARYGAAADVWALGTILFAMLTGEPFLDLDALRSETNELRRIAWGCLTGRERKLVDDVAAKVRADAFLRARHALARRRAPPAACELLEGMLAPRPEERLTAAQALRHPFVAHAGDDGDAPCA